VFATRHVSKGELVLSIPFDLAMSAHNAALDALCKEWSAKSALVRSNPNVQLALLLLHETELGAASKFAPYINILPADVDLPSTHWPHADLAQMQGLTCMVVAMGHASSIATMFCELVESGVLIHAFDDFVWALAIVMSRDNPVYAAASSSSSGGSRVQAPKLGLVPGFDMFNHDPTATAMTTEQNPASFAYEVRAHRDFAAGEEVTIFYGPRPDVQLLVYCGFVALPPGVNANTKPVIAFTVGGSDDALAKARQALLKDVPGVRVLAGGKTMVTVDASNLTPVLAAAMAACATTRDGVAAALRRKLAGQWTSPQRDEVAKAKAVLDEWARAQRAMVTVPATSRRQKLVANLRLSEACAVERAAAALNGLMVKPQ